VDGEASNQFRIHGAAAPYLGVTKKIKMALGFDEFP
jgi:hypothetical protein